MKNKQRSMKVLVSVIFLMLFSSSALAADQYVCIGEKANGFHFNLETKEWEHTKFKPTAKFILRKATEEDRKGNPIIKEHHSWLYIPFGEDFSVPCKDSYLNVNCDLFAGVSISLENLRFWVLNGLALLADPDDIAEQPDSAFIEIGSCSQF